MFKNQKTWTTASVNAEAKGGKRRSAKSLKTGSDKLSDGPETFSSLISAEKTKKVFCD